MWPSGQRTRSRREYGRAVHVDRAAPFIFIHQNTGTPMAMIASPAADVNGLRQISFATTIELTVTKIPGAHGYPQARNGRATSGSRCLSTNTAATAIPEKRTRAKPV